jgi:hypothetical protein
MVVKTLLAYLSFDILIEDSDTDRHDDGQACPAYPGTSINTAAARTSLQLTGDELTLVSYPTKSTGAYRSNAIQRHCTANGQGSIDIMNTTSLKTSCESIVTPTSHAKYYRGVTL